MTDPESSRSGHEDDFGGFFAVVSTYLHDMKEQRRNPVVRMGGRQVKDKKVLVLVEEAARAEDERAAAASAQEPKPAPSTSGEPRQKPDNVVSAVAWVLVGGGVGLLLVAAVDRLMR